MKAEMKVILAFPGKRTNVYIHDEGMPPYKFRSKVTRIPIKFSKDAGTENGLKISPSKLPPIYGSLQHWA